MIQMFVQNLWFVYALATAIIWGLVYTLSEKVLGEQNVTPAALIAVQGTILFFFYWALFFVVESKPVQQITNILSDTKQLALIALIAILTGFAAFFIITSVSLKNATLANFVEISYPFFTMLFSWLLLRNFDLNIESIIGACLIIAGITLIYFKG